MNSTIDFQPKDQNCKNSSRNMTFPRDVHWMTLLMSYIFLEAGSYAHTKLIASCVK